MLEVIIESLEGNTELQSAVRHIMRASDDALPTFQQLTADEPAVANQVLFEDVPGWNPSRYIFEVHSGEPETAESHFTNKKQVVPDIVESTTVSNPAILLSKVHLAVEQMPSSSTGLLRRY